MEVIKQRHNTCKNVVDLLIAALQSVQPRFPGYIFSLGLLSVACLLAILLPQFTVYTCWDPHIRKSTFCTGYLPNNTVKKKTGKKIKLSSIVLSFRILTSSLGKQAIIKEFTQYSVSGAIYYILYIYLLCIVFLLRKLKCKSPWNIADWIYS